MWVDWIVKRLIVLTSRDSSETFRNNCPIDLEAKRVRCYFLLFYFYRATNLNESAGNGILTWRVYNLRTTNRFFSCDAKHAVKTVTFSWQLVVHQMQYIRFARKSTWFHFTGKKEPSSSFSALVSTFRRTFNQELKIYLVLFLLANLLDVIKTASKECLQTYWFRTNFVTFYDFLNFISFL